MNDNVMRMLFVPMTALPEWRTQGEVVRQNVPGSGTSMLSVAVTKLEGMDAMKNDFTLTLGAPQMATLTLRAFINAVEVPLTKTIAKTENSPFSEHLRAKVSETARPNCTLLTATTATQNKVARGAANDIEYVTAA